MKKPILLLVYVLVAAGCNKGAGGFGGGAAPKLESDQDKTLYALGLLLGRNLVGYNLTSSDLTLVQAGLVDAISGAKPKVELETYARKVSELSRNRASARADKEKEKAKPFLEKAAKEQGATQTPSGLVFRTLTPGTGESPQATDVVKVNYRGTLIDGTEFDSTAKHGGEPSQFAANRVIPCWTEGVQRMKVGEKARLVCPSSIAYGDGGRPPTIPGGSTLIFEIELLGIMKPEAQPGMTGMPPGAMPQGHPGLGRPLTLPPASKQAARPHP